MKKIRLVLAVLVLASVLTVVPSAAMAGPPGPSILDIAKSNDDFSILVAALEAADLAETFDRNRQFTVFAPTNDAFVALLDELGLTAEELLSNKELLTAVLLYHVSPGRRYATDVLSSDRIRMLNKQFASISVTGDGAFIDGAKIVATDIEARNGVIHVIDAVLLPD
jgi:uncharacterized surface protein with fasciclin (FAS1) repeats